MNIFIGPSTIKQIVFVPPKILEGGVLVDQAPITLQKIATTNASGTPTTIIVSEPIPLEAEYSVTIEQVPTIQLDSSGLSGNGTITNPVSSTTYSSSVKKFTAIYSGTLNWSAYIGSDGDNSTYMELQLADGTPLQRLSGESENRSGSYSVVAGTQYQIRSHYGGNRITSMRIADNSIPNAYYIDGSLNPELFFEESKRYRFDVSDPSNLGFRFRFSTTEDGIHNGGIEYFNVDVQGNPGETESYVDIIIPINGQIYYYNVENSNFGNPLRTRNLVLGNSYLDYAVIDLVATKNINLGSSYLNYIKTTPVSTMYVGNSYLDYAIVNAIPSKNINLGSSYLNYITEV